MGRYTGPKGKLSRREGVNLHLKGTRSFSDKNALNRKPFVPGQHGNKRRQRLSDYGIHLREKQKVKRTYGMRERQFKNVYKEADRRSKVNNSDKAGFAPSRAAARQAVVHGHMLVNGKKLDIPSYELNEGDSIELKMAKLAPAEKLFPVPEWIEVKSTKAKVSRLPIRDEIDEGIRENLIMEFYSR